MRMRSCIGIAVAALITFSAIPSTNAAIVLDLPSVNATPNSSISVPATFSAVPDESLPLGGFALYISITGPSNGVTLGSAVFPAPFNTIASNFKAAAGAPAMDVYEYTDFNFTGVTFPSADGAVLATITANIAADAAPGVYHLDWYLVDDGYKTVVLNIAEIAEIPMSFTGGTITVSAVPEPAVVLSLAAFSATMLLRPRAKRD